MGISILNAEAIVREHVYRRLTGRIVTVGRQTMLFSPKDAIDILDRCGVPTPSVDPSSIALDNQTRLSTQGSYIRDDAFFRFLGVERLESIDCSPYEGASIVHDLNEPLPDHLDGVADVIIDGSTLDNVFNPALALQNLCRMLKPSGRLISINMGSNHYCPYLILTPPWLYDYFVVNEWVDCWVYVHIYSGDNSLRTHIHGRVNVFALDPTTMSVDNHVTPTFESGYMTGLFVVAEKGVTSTWHRTPIQNHYRNDELRKEYSRKLESILKSTRSDIFFSTVSPFVNAQPGYRFIPSAPGAADSRALETSALVQDLGAVQCEVIKLRSEMDLLKRYLAIFRPLRPILDKILRR